MKETNQNQKKKTPLFFIVLGIISAIWFLLRVIPKPSRITYPCQRMAAANTVAFLTWLFGTGISLALFKKAGKKLKESRIPIATLLILLAVIAGLSTILISSYPDIKASVQQRTMAFNPTDLNQPIGNAKGLYPGRVVWAYNANAIKYDPAAANGNWWEDRNTLPESVDSMLSIAIDGVTGATRNDYAWDELFRYRNIRNGKGDVGYSPGEKIAIKVNLVLGLAGGKGQANSAGPSPQLLYSMIKDLITEVGVPGNLITVYDVSARIPDFIMKPFKEDPNPEFNKVRFVGNPGYITDDRYLPAQEDMDAKIHFADSTVSDVYLVKSVTGSDYLINFTNLKTHTMAGVTLCAKNLYGSVYFPTATGLYTFGFGPRNDDEHSGLHKCAAVHDFQDGNVGFFPGREMGTYNYLVDLMGHPEFYNKTILYVVDGLYGGSPQNKIAKFSNFGDNYSASIFLSQDPVAIESVCLDFLRSEPVCDEYVYGNVDNYMHEAALANDPPSGVVYNPGAEESPLQSLGVHEHWNNAVDKQYSKNLGTGEGIELVSYLFPIKSTVGMEKENAVIESARNYPNPFTSSTTIEFNVLKASKLEVEIFDNSGKRVVNFGRELYQPGCQTVQWNSENAPSGIYYCRIGEDSRKGRSFRLVKQ